MQANFEKLFGPAGKHMFPLVTEIAKETHSWAYSFCSPDECARILSENLSEGMKTYWIELLARSHMAAICSLKRSFQWAHGSITAYDNGNYLNFAAALRGLLESCADSFYSLASVGLKIAQNFKVIQAALGGHQTEIVVSKELEEALIHFTHARKLPDEFLKEKYHRALSIKEYLKIMNDENNDRYNEFYSLLCDVTHPAAYSIAYLFEGNEGVLRYRGEPDRFAIEQMTINFASIFHDMLCKGLNPAFVVLKTLNLLQGHTFRTEIMNAVSLEELPLWKKIMNEKAKS